ncbi:hypothetical protein CDIK_1670 [Cucumispora dikerogammari]|nr:hypothetical protein CDIK_1670 [Cucumispora dikerogammari]
MVLREKNVEDGLRWRCLRRYVLNGKLVSKKNSIFFGLRLPLKTIVMILYLWSRDTLIKDIIHELEVGFDGVKSVLDVIRLKFKQQENLKFGDSGCIVEVDETKLTKRKGNVERVSETIWCVGGICRVHKNFFYELVKKRSADILHGILKRRVRLASTVISDEWEGYSEIDKVFSRHLKINHSKYFVDSVNHLIHTQGIEYLWGKLKRYIKNKERTKKQLYEV